MILHIPVGIPGCGKSTIAEVYGGQAISTDVIRETLTGDTNDQSRNDDVFKTFHSEIRWFMERGYSVYADATNLTGRSRLRKIVTEIRESSFSSVVEVKTHLILFRNLGQAIARNSARERMVPADVMMRMIEKYERAVLDIPHEGYDHVTEVSAVG